MSGHGERALGVDELSALLWPQGDRLDTPAVYAIVDAAQDPRMAGWLAATGLEQACLFAGNLSPALRAVSPHLVHLAPDVAFTRHLFASGWGRSWFILCITPSDVTLAQLRRHCRTLLRVRDESDRKFLFRFYDPRVLRAYLPTCTQAELELCFGPVDALACESGGADALVMHERDADLPVLRVSALATIGALRNGVPPQSITMAARTSFADREA